MAMNDVTPVSQPASQDLELGHSETVGSPGSLEPYGSGPGHMSHRYGNTTISDHATAIMGDVHHVYNFCISPDGIERYRRSVVNCFQDTINEVVDRYGLGNGGFTPFPSSAQRSFEQTRTLDASSAKDALAVAVEEAKKQGRVPQISEDAFAALFQPSEIVVTYLDGVFRAHKIDSIRQKDRTTTELQVWSWDFDGSFYKCRSSLVVEHPRPGQSIFVTELSCWPIKYDRSQLEAELRRRGSKFWDLRNRTLVEYTAFLSGTLEADTDEQNSRYMVDMEVYKMLQPELHPVRRDAVYHKDQWGDANVPPSDEFAIMLPATIKGFGFKSKTWRNLHVNNIRNVCWNEEAFSRVVLKQSEKELILALVSQHNTSAGTNAHGHARTGLKFLFHGPSGSGKKVTAESVAEVAQKPLYTINCGDIGVNSESAEKYLKTALLVGNMWGCIILLADADMFLEQRNQSGMLKSALVATFLRVLNKYEGIIIFTTTRVGVFDEDVKSLIHLRLKFWELGTYQRKYVWENFITMLEEKGVNMNKWDIMNQVHQFAQVELNGRQIGHVVSAAQGLASYRHQQLAAQHFETAMKPMIDFDNDLLKEGVHQDGTATDSRAHSSGDNETSVP